MQSPLVQLIGSVVGSTDWSFLCSEYKKNARANVFWKKIVRQYKILRIRRETMIIFGWLKVLWRRPDGCEHPAFMGSPLPLLKSKPREALWHQCINATNARKKNEQKNNGERILFKKKKSGEHHTCLEIDSVSMIWAQTTKQSQYKKKSKMWAWGVWSGGAEDLQVVWSPVFRLGIWLDHSETDGPEEFKTGGKYKSPYRQRLPGGGGIGNPKLWDMWYGNALGPMWRQRLGH